MKKVELTQNQFAIVDDEDFEKVSNYKWRVVAGYASTALYIKGSGRKSQKQQHIYMHRLINKTPKGMETDHINRNKLDNRKENLRTVTHQINLQNQGKRKNNTSGYSGVGWVKAHKRWIATIKVNGKLKYLGEYLTLQGAWLARRFGERIYYAKIKDKISIYRELMNLKGGEQSQMNVKVETKGGNVVAVTDDSGTAVTFTVSDTSSTPVEVVAKAAADAALAADGSPSTGSDALAAAKAAADATAAAADAEAAKFDAAATPAA